MYKRHQSTSVAVTLEIAKDMVQYDKYAKLVLSNKQILARVFEEVVWEVKGYSIDEIAKMIEGDPLVSIVPVEPGMTNTERIKGGSVEDEVPGEGRITFDILTRLVVPDMKETIEILVNIEVQREQHPGYSLFPRALFYSARMISSQKETEFTKSNYDEIKKVYSIWICFGNDEKDNNSISQYSISKQDLLGKTSDEDDYDLLSIVFVKLGNRFDEKMEKSLLKMLVAVFDEKLSVYKKKQILSEEYGIMMTRRNEKELEQMGELAYGIFSRSIKEGIEQGIEQGEINMLYRLTAAKKIDVEQAAEEAGISVEEFCKNMRDAGYVISE